MTTPVPPAEQPGRAVPRRRALRLTLICVAVAALTLLAATFALSSR
jgi:hypothetical protein